MPSFLVSGVAVIAMVRVDVVTAGDGDVQHLDKLSLEALSELMVHLMNEPAFDQLRTKEQLGYIVHTSLKKVSAVLSS